jgi:hypothetical protein
VNFIWWLKSLCKIFAHNGPTFELNMFWPNTNLFTIKTFFMQNIKKFSILGLVLIAASAVTAAVIPSKSENKKVEGFSLTQSEGNGVSSISCEATAGEVTAPCAGDERSTLNQSGSTSQAIASDEATTL